jgi:flagellar hook-basal body complex protein FliE
MPLPLTPGGAAAAYRANMSAPSAAAAATGGGETASFGEALSRAVQNAVSTSREAEAASARGLMGEGSVTDLVVAVGLSGSDAHADLTPHWALRMCSERQGDGRHR